MYDDYETNFFCENDFIIDEDSYYEHHHRYHSNIIRDDTYHLQDNGDDEYERDTQDYQALAYHHYAWYNSTPIHNEMIMYAQKRRICITLEVECYDDYPLEDLDWRDLLSLEGDERVNVNIDDIIDVF